MMEKKGVSQDSRPRLFELVGEGGTCPAPRFALSGDSVTIGRGKDNDLVVLDPRVSRQHARLAWDGSRYVIQDLHSLNGICVEGQRIAGVQALHNGDRIELAPGLALAYLVRSHFSAS